MVILKQLKKQINQFVSPEIEPIPEGHIDIYPEKKRNHIPPQPKEPDAFQATHQNAYSHGLENIYALETVDAKTIKPLGLDTTEVEAEDREAVEVGYAVTPDSQLELHLGGQFRTHVESLVLNEPVYVLNLSPVALKTLSELGLFLVRDLIGYQWNTVSKGHANEIQQQLEEYLEDKNIADCQTINFESWVRCLIPEEDQLKTFLVLKTYGLSHLIALTPTMNVELKRLSTEVKAQYRQEGIEKFRSTDRYAFARQVFKGMIDTFLIPWIRGRSGIARCDEIYDRLEQVSDKPLSFDQTFQFLKDLYFDGESPVSEFLSKLSCDVWCVDEIVEDQFRSVEGTALSYFVQNDSTYTLKELVQWVSREFAYQWKGYEDGFIEKVIRNSDKFRCYGGDDQELWVVLG